MMTDDDDQPQLSAETLKALEEWRQEQEANRAANIDEEDWVKIDSFCFFCSFDLDKDFFLAIESILVQRRNVQTFSR